MVEKGTSGAQHPHPGGEEGHPQRECPTSVAAQFTPAAESVSTPFGRWAGAPLPNIERLSPPLEGFQPVLVEGWMSHKWTGPRGCTVTAEVEYHYLPLSEDPLGGGGVQTSHREANRR